MKRWILLLCCILLALSVTGCTGENSSSDSSSEPSSSQTQLQEDPVDPETAAALELVRRQTAKRRISSQKNSRPSTGKPVRLMRSLPLLRLASAPPSGHR